jgi:hypothetical protein
MVTPFNVEPGGITRSIAEERAENNTTVAITIWMTDIGVFLGIYRRVYLYGRLKKEDKEKHDKRV